MSQIKILEELKKYPEGRTKLELMTTLNLTAGNISEGIGGLRKTFIIESQRIDKKFPTVRYILIGPKYDHEHRDKDRKVGKELEKIACKTFVCTHMNELDIKGKELGLNNDIISLAKDLATEYFKKTYHKPEYAGVNRIIPAFFQIASKLEIDENGKRIYVQSQPGYREGIGTELSILFNVSASTIMKWNRHITSVLNIDRR